MNANKKLFPPGLRVVSGLNPLVINQYYQPVDIHIPEERGFAFVIMPFNPAECDQTIHFEVVKPLLEEEFQLMCLRADEETGPGVVNNQIFTYIVKANFLIAEVTSKNPNVLYELGLAHAFNKPSFILVHENARGLPFDLSTVRAIVYRGRSDLTEKLRMAVGDFLANPAKQDFYSHAIAHLMSEKLQIHSPKDGEIVQALVGHNTARITVSGRLDPSETEPGRKVMLVIRTDQDYPQEMCAPREDGSWKLTGRLGGVDHEIFALLLNERDKPLLSSNIVRVRVVRSI